MTMNKNQMTQQQPESSRRNLLKGAAWSAPVVLAISLPKHAQATKATEVTTTYFLEDGVEGLTYTVCIEVIDDMYTLTYSEGIIDIYRVVFTGEPAAVGSPVTLNTSCTSEEFTPVDATLLSVDENEAILDLGGMTPGSLFTSIPAAPCATPAEDCPPQV